MGKTYNDVVAIIVGFNKRDAYHQRAVYFTKFSPYQYFTTWPVITESSHMLDFSKKAQGHGLKSTSPPLIPSINQ